MKKLKYYIPISEHLRTLRTAPSVLQRVWHWNHDFLHLRHFTNGFPMHTLGVVGQGRLPGEVRTANGTGERSFVCVEFQVCTEGCLSEDLRAQGAGVFDDHCVLITNFPDFFDTVPVKGFVEVAFGLGVSSEETLAAVPYDRGVESACAWELTGVVFEVSAHFLGEDEGHPTFRTAET